MDPLSSISNANGLKSIPYGAEQNSTTAYGTQKNERSPPTRAQDIVDLIQRSLNELIPFILKADQERLIHHNDEPLPLDGTALVKPLALDFESLQARLVKDLRIWDAGVGAAGFQDTVASIMEHSVNPLAPGFMDKLYSAPVAPGIAAELILAVLNANLHVYQVSPALTVVEKSVTKQLATMFGLNTPRAGGISVTGGSASNLTSIVVARNSLFPDTKAHGNSANGRRLVMFTSAHGHYSIEKAAQGLGFGSSAVIAVPTDSLGRMKPEELERLIIEAKARGETPFYINATAGTTVLGSFDPFDKVSTIARKHRCWFHIDGAWGGGFVFSKREDISSKLTGSHLADSVAINPHKMLGVPVTCSVLLTRDLRLFHDAMTLKAGYLFHEPEDDDLTRTSDVFNDETEEIRDISEIQSSEVTPLHYDRRDENDSSWTEPNDLADMTLQCGRRGDGLKFFLAWQYYGTAGYAKLVEDAFDVATHMAQLVDASKDLALVLGPGSKPSCLQVCFYYTPDQKFFFGLKDKSGMLLHPTARSEKEIGKQNTRVTSRISKALIPKGFMIDFAPALEGQEDRGSFLRVVVNISTQKETAARLVKDILEVGSSVVEELQEQFSSMK